ncbi:MAG: heat-inducible transcription repressor HrcA [Deltaproteobacteria bacterium]|nr:heat-inducible transcription repressor HrcA [Deltaproteobacteria bacterium]
MADMLSNRARGILRAIVEDYTYTAEPVGSRTIVKRYALDISPATVRSIMADLEEEDYLIQPYPSAGRIPTDKGFRLYVDSLLKVRQLSKDEQERICSRYKDSMDVGDIIKETSKILSTISGCIGLVLAPRFDSVIIKHIQFIRLGYKQVLILLVSSTGLVQTKAVHTESDIGQPDLDRMSAYLRSMAAGLTLMELRARVVEEMGKEKNLYDRLMAKALEMGKKAFMEGDEGDVYVGGRVNIIDQPEFAKDVERMKALFKAFEEKGILVKLLDRGFEAGGVQIFIGSENELSEIKGCSLVTSTYGSGGYVLGTLGVIGPIRMDYSRVIPLVDWTARLLGDMLTTKVAEGRD